jgi:hypothetical protein
MAQLASHFRFPSGTNPANWQSARVFSVVKKLPIRLPNSVHGKERLWTKAALADWANCSFGFLDEEVRAGRLKALRLSHSRIRYRWADIEAWLATKELQTT